MAAPPNALGHLAAPLHGLDGLLAVTAPVGEVLGVVPGEVLGAARKEDLIQDVAGIVGLFVLVVEVVDSNLVLGRPHVRQLEFIELLALVDGGDLYLVRVQLLVWSRKGNGARVSFIVYSLLSCCVYNNWNIIAESI